MNGAAFPIRRLKSKRSLAFMLQPETFYDYSIHSLLGEGDIAIVYRAMNRLSGQQVALKMLRLDSPVPESRAYFDNERVILAQLKHPNIPTLYKYIDGETPCLALTLIEGKDGETLLAELPAGAFLSARSVIEWGIQIADALACLHNHHPPLVFRDLKPSHMIVDGDSRAWLVDFNLAKIVPESKVLHDADLMGTEGFAAPEQYQGTVSPLVDVYALGATLHYLLTRINPRHERRFTYAPPRSVNPVIPKSAEQVIMKALAYEPEDRYEQIEGMRDILKDVLTAES